MARLDSFVADFGARVSNLFTFVAALDSCAKELDSSVADFATFVRRFETFVGALVSFVGRFATYGAELTTFVASVAYPRKWRQSGRATFRIQVLVRTGHVIDLFEGEPVPHLRAEVGIMVEEEFDEAVSVDQNQVCIVAFGMPCVAAKPPRLMKTAFSPVLGVPREYKCTPLLIYPL